MACGVVHRALTLLIVLRLGLSEARRNQGRDLLGSDTVFQEEQLSHLEVPRNAEVLIQAETDCPEPLPVEEQANNGLLCGFVLRARGCLSYSDTKPFWVGRNCKGQTCTAVNSPWETECILGNYGVHVDVKNKTRAATCGLDPADVSWLSPAINPAANTCSIVTPDGVRSDTWAECVNGRPKLQYRLTFDPKTRPMPKNKLYNCKISPMCLHGKPRRFHSRMICYLKGTGLAEAPEVEGADLEGSLEMTEGVDGGTMEESSGENVDVGSGLRWTFAMLMGLVWLVQ